MSHLQARTSSSVVSDETSYRTRLARFFDLTYAGHLFHKKETIQQCQDLLNLIKQDGAKPAKRDEELVRCSSIVSACVHPTSGKIIPPYGRMALFVPINIPICAGMILAPPTLPNVIFWQWINQTYNAVFNYSNSACADTERTQVSAHSTPLEKVYGFFHQNKSLLQAYTSAVAVSVTLAVGLNRCLQRARLGASAKRVGQVLVPYTAVASAAVTNVGLMRADEWKKGIPVYTPDDQYVGMSRVAAKKALFETSIARLVLSIPIFFLPPPILSLLFRVRAIREISPFRVTAQLSAVTSAIAVGLPAALALYPQTATMPVSRLEEPLQENWARLMDLARDAGIRAGNEKDACAAPVDTSLGSGYVIFQKGV